MKHSIYIRNFYMTAGIVFLSFLILGSMFFLWSYRLVINQKQETMYDTACETTRFISAYDQVWALSTQEMRVMITLISNSSGYHIIVTDVTGVIVSSSDKAVVSDFIGKTIPKNILDQVGPAAAMPRIPIWTACIRRRAMSWACRCRTDRISPSRAMSSCPAGRTISTCSGVSSPPYSC